MQKLNATQLKYIALIFMTFEHVCFIFSADLPDALVVGTKILGRIVAPLFIFLALESFYHTSNRLKYLQRLLIAAVIMQVGNTILSNLLGASIQLNILASLACSIAIVWLLDSGLKTSYLINKSLLFMGALMLFIVALFLEGSYLVPTLMLAFYFFRSNRLAIYLSLLALSIFYALPALNLVPVTYFTFPPQWGMILTVPLLALYNGEKGAGNKYLFYTYYPLHAWILYFLRWLIR
jgi:hypothetical protein